MIDKLSAKDRIKGLVTRFEEQYHSYKSSEYNETLTRRDFIDPFFKTLGWDIDNEAGYAEAYREVIHEDKVKVSGATKAPDYSFRLVGGKRLFFVEAKKPYISVKEDIQPAYQVRRYGWSAKLPISIITDFEEFSVYDCTKKPKPIDKPTVSRIKYLSFQEYLSEFDFLWNTFSKEQVLKGSFDKFLQSDTNKKGTATVDNDFLESLDRWRTYLAVNISWNNKTLDEDEINYIVQQTIDRLIFLRIAEDRSVEPYGTLKYATKHGNLYQNLFELFQKADDKYNSGLFDFKKDKISQSIVIENKIIRTIINELYYPECPYEFSVLPVEILGSAYEQFLGKVIRITSAHHAKIEEKPEVRKAGGVYYTPQYIVDYIVKNTVGKLIEGKTPKEISKIRILDPACGSGSFLIGAFQYLLDYHKDYYSENGKPSKGKKDNPLTPDGHLTTGEKKRILLNNIYGVDLDTNAVEVTKLSLLIKSLEGETEASIKQQLTIWNERILPTLENNIKSGNSLIDIDFYKNELELGFEKRIKPFSWTDGFPEILSKGGFDIVIGNPPYVLGRETFDDSIKKYISTNYNSYGGKFDLYIFFCEKALRLLNKDGIFSFIVPNTILANENSRRIRQIILENYCIRTIRTFQNLVFDKAQVETIIIVIENKNAEETSTVSIESELVTSIPLNTFRSNSNYKFNVGLNIENDSILDKIQEQSIPLGTLVDICIGIQLGGSHGKTVKKDFISDECIDDNWKKVLDGKDINTYKKNPRNVFVHYGPWLHRKRDEKYFLNPKILIRQIGHYPIATIDEENYYTLNTIYNLISQCDYSLKYILAAINSNICRWYWNKINTDFKSLFPKIKKSEIETIPILTTDYKNKDYLTIIRYVDQLIMLNRQISNSNLQSTAQQLSAKVKFYENQINSMFYNGYGLSQEEKSIIEKDLTVN